MPGPRLSGKGVKSGGPPVFSVEFFIANHADIVSTFCTIVFIGLVFQTTQEAASTFIFVQHNVTIFSNITQKQTGLIEDLPPPLTLYRHGPLDVNTVTFYTLIWVVIHAVLQQYIWERTVRKLKLSKTRTSKYYDSGLLVAFYLMSVLWGMDHIIKEGYCWNVRLIWQGYPHSQMTFSLKFFMLQQMAFWLHCYPEIYLMKQTRGDGIYRKLVLYTSSLFIILGAYVIQLQRLAIILLTLHYLVEMLFHAARLVKYHGKKELAMAGYYVWKVLFVLARALTVVLSVLTLWFGLGREEVEQGGEAEGEEEEEEAAWPKEFNTPTFRLVCLACLLGIQGWIAWTFLMSQMRRGAGPSGLSEEDDSAPSEAPATPPQKTNKRGKNLKKE